MQQSPKSTHAASHQHPSSLCDPHADAQRRGYTLAQSSIGIVSNELAKMRPAAEAPNDAVTVLLPFMVRLQLEVPEQEPLQPPNVELIEAAAVKLTLEPAE